MRIFLIVDRRDLGYAPLGSIVVGALPIAALRSVDNYGDRFYL